MENPAEKSTTRAETEADRSQFTVLLGRKDRRSARIF
jgi:hypothetical protein